MATMMNTEATPATPMPTTHVKSCKNQDFCSGGCLGADFFSEEEDGLDMQMGCASEKATMVAQDGVLLCGPIAGSLRQMGKTPSGAMSWVLLVSDEIQECEVTSNFLSGRLNAHPFLLGDMPCTPIGA
jgi:hypothetical protein